MFSKKATKIDEIFTVALTVTTYCQIDGDDFVNFCGLFVENINFKVGKKWICKVNKQYFEAKRSYGHCDTIVSKLYCDENMMYVQK